MIAGGPRLKRWTLEEYHRFVELGAIGPEARVELIDGEIVEKMGARPKHSNTVASLGALLAELFGSAYHVREEKPVTLTASEPEPDLAVIQSPRAEFFGRHPRASETALLVEVSDTTLLYDRNVKASLYAREGVAEYWIVDLSGRHLIVHRGPLSDGGWTEIRTLDPGERVAPLSAPEAAIDVAEILPPDELAA